MKSKFNLILLSLAILALSSCGGANSTSSTSSNLSTVSVSSDGATTVGTSTNNFRTIEQVRAAFDSMSFKEGLSQGTYIYHVGSDYSTSNSSTSINISGCFFGLFGDCSNSNSSDITSQLEAYLDAGRMLQVGSLDNNTSMVNLNEAIGVANNDFIFDSYVYSLDSFDYKEMLGLNRSYAMTKLSSATVTLTNGTSFDAVVVEFVDGVFRTVRSVKSFVLSTNVPVAANPIALIESGFNERSTVRKVLKSVGSNIEIKSIVFDKITAINGDRELIEKRNSSIVLN